MCILVEKMGVNYIIRIEREGVKVGNLNNVM